MIVYWWNVINQFGAVFEDLRLLRELYYEVNASPFAACGTLRSLKRNGMQC